VLHAEFDQSSKLNLAFRVKFIECLADMAERFQVRVHAYVLMGHHYHPLISLAQPNISRAES
jgi:REP element-mobilizing transposase RayT